MERRNILLRLCSLMLGVVFLITSCGERQCCTNKIENNITLDTIFTESRYHLEGDTANPYCDIRVDFVYPLRGEDEELDSVQQFFVRAMFGAAYEGMEPTEAMNAYVKNYVDNYSRDAAIYQETASTPGEFDVLMLESIQDHDHPGLESSDKFYSYHESISDTIIYNRHGLISFQVRQSNNKGGAASYELYRNYVYDLKREVAVTESDLFNAGYDTALRQLIVVSLLEQNKVKSIEELEDLGFFGIQEILPNKNFLLSDKGIIYTFNKGEYSAYQLDAPEVMIPYGSIRSLLRENGVASKLADFK